MLLWCWCFWDSVPFCSAWLVEKLFIPSLVAALVYFLGIRQLKTKRRIDFAKEQLTEFYGPMVAARAQVEGFTRFDRILRAAAGHADSLHQDRYRGRGITSEYLAEMDEYSKELERFYGGLNDRFRTTGIDALIRMRDLFAQKIVFADPDTQPWFEYFHAFVEMWSSHRDNLTNQFMSRTVAGTVGAMFDEGLLQPFYAHLRERAAYYHAEIARKPQKCIPAPAVPTLNVEDLIDKVESNPLLQRRRGPQTTSNES